MVFVITAIFIIHRYIYIMLWDGELLEDMILTDKIEINNSIINPRVKVAPSAINRTDAKSEILVYNRVPKCASTTVINILKKLSVEKKFNYIHSRIYSRRGVNISEEKILANMLAGYKKPLVFDRQEVSI